MFRVPNKIDFSVTDIGTFFQKNREGRILELKYEFAKKTHFFDQKAYVFHRIYIWTKNFFCICYRKNTYFFKSP